MFDRQPPAPPSLRNRRTTGERLRDALLEIAGSKAIILAHREKSWASITFAGSRHSIELGFEGREAVHAGEQFIVTLPDHEFGIPGRLVAEAAVVEAVHRLDPPSLRVTCDLLLLEDA
ncbi:hypothetical protein GCM10011515_14150 [Tsuneonella deserti]|uniref:Uncharacterized protein n=1 Tax=Tsuneonella deserti TaxID=2035528 RepID=A0ABQ1S9E4_9SPHN|nr:hypothetical protein [Tsuneonella deserti]GGD95475.1 hypothetical protein GCM10011515_14150 [Tsuneonella deserti]